MVNNRVEEVSAKYLVDQHSLERGANEGSREANPVPVGYKQTEVGVIPEDWVVRSLRNISVLERGKFSARPRNDPKFFGGKIPFIQTGDITRSNGYEVGFSQTLNETGVSVSRVFPAGTLFFTIAANIADMAIVKYAAACPDSLIAIKPMAEVHKRWLYHYLSARKQEFEALATHNAQLNINLEKLNPYCVAVPSLKEQTAIANALSDVDALISNLESLIAKKQAIKTATMQQLLTGRIRLPQFALREDGSPKGYKQSELGEVPEDWEVNTFGEVTASCSSGATPYRGRSEFYKGNNRWITSGELNYCVINDTLEKISDEAIKKANLKVHPKGTFLMAITGLEAAGTRGACGIVGEPSATNQSCMAIYPNHKLISIYLYHWYVFNGQNLAFTYCQGTKQMSYTAGLIRKIPICLPVEVSEQTAIAIILSDMDHEIQTLEQRLNKTRQIKQGMMQQLLTGKIRLVKPEAI